MLEICSLPARQGDAIWIEWGDDPDDPHRMIIDMGTGGSGKKIRERILQLPEDRRRFDLIVVTHVDEDHIGGLLTCLAEADPIAGFAATDVWFNGFQHLSGQTVGATPNLEPLGPVQGELLSNWLRDHAWNNAFGGGPVRRVPGEPIARITLHDGLTLSVLGPTPERLENFIDTWKEEVQIAIEKGRLDDSMVSPGLEVLGTDEPPVLENMADLEELADESVSKDNSEANGSSIALLLEHEDRAILLSGDAFSDDLIDGIDALSPGARLKLDLFKLPHHGSKKNVHRALIESVECEQWLISTDGTRFKHPDAEAIARILASADTESILLFNVPSRFNEWWQNEDWRNLFGYRTKYGTTGKGLKLTF
jgi:hypothetical protein